MLYASESQRINWFGRIVAVTLLVAVIIAPTCPALCASQACPEPGIAHASQSGCHGHDAMKGDASLLVGAGICRGPELQAIVVARGEWTKFHQSNAPSLVAVFASDPTDAESVTSELWPGPPRHLLNPDISFRSTVLRI